ncbi:MAG: hypothetical protein KGR16_01570 [Verrucomicrobia bacterium]|nr:hypothetical protein [Verrucomicrobiota bacterium]
MGEWNVDGIGIHAQTATKPARILNQREKLRSSYVKQAASMIHNIPRTLLWAHTALF